MNKPEYLSNVASWLEYGATVFFGILSIYFYAKSRKTKLITAIYSSTALQSKNHPEVEIMFRGRPINNLIKIVLAFWNG